MPPYRPRLIGLLLLASLAGPHARADDPTDNPVATFYSGAEGYPAWTDGIRWSRVINMKTYKGKNEYDKFVKARNELASTGGVLYYPAGTYDFTSAPRGKGMNLFKGIVIRGEAPSGRPLATDGKLELPTKFVFTFRKRGGGLVPNDYNQISLEAGEAAGLKDMDNVGVAWVHMVGATIYFGPEVEWGKSWGKTKGWLSDKVRTGWGARLPGGAHPGDVLVGGTKKYVGAGKGRLVFGCVMQDSAVLNDFLDLGYGPNGFHTEPHCARIAAYGSRVLVANNLLPRSAKNFKYKQTTNPHRTNKGSNTVLFDYGKTIGIDVNKELLSFAADEGKCPGYVEEGVVVRDNYVYNHGQKGFSVAGKWVTIANNRNDRAFLRQGDDVYGLGPAYALTVDGWQCSGTTTDNKSNAFDLAGRNLWIDGNRFNNVGSFPGNDGEGIFGQAEGGTNVYSWAITRNTHVRDLGTATSLGGRDVDCHGLLIGWNKLTGWVGNDAKRKGLKMADCAFVANKGNGIRPDAKTLARLEIPAPLTDNKPASPTPPTKVTAAAYKDDAVKITWADASDDEVGFRVERRIGEGKWHIIAYRPPHRDSDSDNPQEWIDFTAPPGKKLTYRVVAVAADDSDKGASKATPAVTLSKPDTSAE